MLYPRLVSLGITLLSAVVMWFSLSHFSLQEQAEIVIYAAVLGMFFGLGGIFVGLGGIVASFGLELVRPGCFRTRNNCMGRSIEWLQVESESFCGVAGACGLVLFVALLAALFGTLVIFVIVPNWSAFAAHLPEMLLSLAQLLGALLLVLGPVVLASRFPWVGWPILIITYTGLAYYGVATKGPPPMEAFDALVIAYGVGFSLLAVGYGLYRLREKLPGYSNVCPGREKK